MCYLSFWGGFPVLSASFSLAFPCASSFTTTLLAALTLKHYWQLSPLSLLSYGSFMEYPCPPFCQGLGDMSFSTWSLLEPIWLEITLLPVSCPVIKAFMGFSLILKYCWHSCPLCDITGAFRERKSPVSYSACVFPRFIVQSVAHTRHEVKGGGGLIESLTFTYFYDEGLIRVR